MSFSSGEDRKRPGIFESFRAAMTPAPLPEDDGLPIAPPRTINIATALCLIGALIFIFIGTVSLLNADEQLNQAVSNYEAGAKDCEDQGIGIGEAAKAAPDTASAEDKAFADNCKNYTYGLKVPQDVIDSFKTQNTIISAVIIMVGLLAGAGGWFLRAGARWARLMVIGAVLLSVILTMLFQVSNLFTLVATLLIVVATMLSFIGKGGVYFARIRARRASS